MTHPHPYEDRYPLFVNFILSCWNQTAIYPTIPEAAEAWVAVGNDGMIRLLDRELRQVLADGELMAELANRKSSDRLAAAWGGMGIATEDVRTLAAHVAKIIEVKSAEAGWWDRSKREMDWYQATEKQRPD